MFNLLKRNRNRALFVGEILFSILIFPFAFTFLEKWVVNVKDPELPLWLCALCAAIGLVRLFRGLRQRGHSPSAFVIQLACAVAHIASGVFALIHGYNTTTCVLVSLTYWACMLVGRVHSIVRNHRPWNILLNAVTILAIIAASIIADNYYSIFLVAFTASILTFISIMVAIFSRIRVDILRQILQKTYARRSSPACCSPW